MCYIFVINDKHLSTIKELADVLGGLDKIPIDNCYSNFNISENEKTCLCPVDVQKVVDILGQRAISNGMDIYFGKSGEQIEKDDICGESWEVGT